LFGLLYGVLFAREELPTVFYPAPGLVLWPSLLIGPAAILVPMLVFFAWNRGLFNGDSKIPKRTRILLLVATVLSVPWFVAGWRDGSVVEGARYNFSVLGINIAWIAILWFMFVRNRKAEPSFKVNLLLHWFLFAWLAWYAFPFFGDVII